jgi:Ca2+-binding RTX toxin-like protein
MSTTISLFQQAQLAEAAYANFFSNSGNLLTNSIDVKAALEAEGMSSAQATAFLATWQVIDHIPDTTNGFSATLFKNNQTGAYSLAIRGSTPDQWGIDFKIDAALIAANGIAVAQVIDLYNYWQSLNTPLGQTYQAAYLKPALPEMAQLNVLWVAAQIPGNSTGVANYQNYKTQLAQQGFVVQGTNVQAVDFFNSHQVLAGTPLATGKGALSVCPAGLNVAGHSLGGHLAMAFTRLFPSLAIDALAVNGLGFKVGNGTVDALFSRLGGGGAFTKSKIENVYGIAGPEFAAMDNFILQQPGSLDGIFIESAAPLPPITGGHSVTQMTDSLAVYDLFIRIDSSLTGKTVAEALAILNPLFEAASATAATSLEDLVRSLRKLLTGNGALVTTDDRQALYLAIDDINTELVNGPQPERRIVSLTTLSAADLQTAASNPDALATRYALKELTPFAILGDDSRYTPFNTNHELDVFNADTEDGKLGRLTPKWIEDRAKLLYWTLKFNVADGRPAEATQVAEPEALIDMGSKRRLELTPNGGSYQRFKQTVFGTDGAETLKGDIFADHLYGNAGSDTLNGNDGADYLEGGTGDDMLRGGKGFDTYRIDKTSGRDTIIDNVDDGGDGQGSIVYNGQTLFGDLTQDSANRNIYRYAGNPDLQIRFIGADGQRGNLLISDPTGAKITIEDWASGELGLTLNGSVATPIIRPLTIVGDLLPIDFDITTPEENIHYDGLGNVIVNAAQAAPGRDDTLYGSAGNDLIQGLGGDDWIANAGGGEDRIEGGTGSDIINAGAGNDLLIGNADADILAGGAGNDRLFADAEIELANVDLQVGGSGRELLIGGEDDDTLVGAATSDALFGGSGDDVILGGAGDDDIVGDRDVGTIGRDWTLTRSVTTQGDITLYTHTYGGSFVNSVEAAPAGADVLYGGAGNDWILAGAGEDLLDGGADNDVLFGEAGNDVLDGGTGNDILSGDALDTGSPGGLAGSLHGSDWLDGGDGADTLWGNGGSDELFGGTGNDELAGDDNTTPGQFHGADYLDGEDGNDRLWGNGGDDTLFGGADNDHLEGDYNSQKLAGQYHGNDYLDGEAGNDELVGGGGSDTLYGGIGDDVLAGDDTPDAPLAAQYHGNDTLDGGDGADSLYGGGGDDILIGGLGVDDLHGDAGNDTLTGGAGTDNLYGGLGNDTYILAAGDGGAGPQGQVEFIEDTGGIDTLRLDGIAPAQINAFVANGNWLAIDYGAADRVAIINGMGGAIERIVVGGETLSYAQFVGRYSAAVQSGVNVDGNSVQLGGSASDTLTATGAPSTGTGQAGATLSGGLGNDTLTVTGNDNAILYAKGDGTDHVTTGGSGNVLRLGPGIGAADLKLKLGSLALQVGDDPNDLIHFESFDPANALGQTPFDSIEFEDGSTLAYADLLAQGFDITGTAGDDTLTGTSVDDRIDGGAGDDSLKGGGGSDTYQWGTGSDQDSIDNTDASVGRIDTLRIGSETDVITSEQLAFVKSGNDLIIRLRSTTDQVTVLNHYAGAAIDAVRFASGETWGATEIDAHIVNELTEGADIYVGSAGNDVINGLGGADTLSGMAGDDTLIGGAGADTLNGGAGADTLDGRNDAAADLMQGGADGDIYLFGRGSGADTITEGGDALSTDTLRLDAGIATTDIKALRSGSDLVVQIVGTADQVKVSGAYAAGAGAVARIERIEFAPPTGTGLPGEVWTEADIRQRILEGLATAGNDAITGFDGNDTIHGLAGNDALSGLGGDDSLFGEDGNDTLNGDAGSDVLNGGAGTDTLLGGLGSDTYRFGRGSGQDTITEVGTSAGDVDTIEFGADVLPTDVRVTRTLTDLYLTISGTADRLTVRSYFSSDANKVEQVKFSDGTVWDAATLLARSLIATEVSDYLIGGAGADVIDGLGGDDTIDGQGGNDTLAGGAGYDTLFGGAGDDSLDGGTGNDILQGGTGNDIYRFGRGAGQDTLSDSDATAGNVDTVEFDADVLPADVRVTRDANHLYLTINGTTDKLTIQNYFVSDSYKVEQVRFADSTVWNGTVLVARSLIATEGADTLIGGAGTDVIDGLGGNDTIDGQAGSDTLSGGAGNDTLTGGTGDDLLDGGSGTDILQGGTGNDTYRFGHGSGLDVISENDATAGNVDTVEFGVDVLPADVTVTRDLNNHLYLAINGTTDKLTVDRYFLTDAYKVEQVRFADSTVWNAATLLAKSLIATEGADILVGGAGADVIDGLGGNDTIDGQGANDTLSGGSGNDTIYGGAGDDGLDGGAGVDALSGDAGNDVLNGGADDDQLSGGIGNDTLSGDAGRDRLEGGAGGDTYRFGRGDGFDTLVEVSSTTDVDRLVLGAGIEVTDVLLRTNGAETYLSLSGSSDRMLISTTAGSIERIEFADTTVWDAAAIAAHTLTGIANTLTGTAGNDTFSVDNSLDVIVEGVNQGTDTVVADVSYTLGSNVENLTLTGGFDLYGYGNALNNVVIGNSGNNSLSGGNGGNDTLTGGAGDDTYYLGDNSASIVELADEGVDSVLSKYGVTLPGNVENLRVYSGTGGYYIYKNAMYGNSLDNAITARHGDVVDGKAGADTMVFSDYGSGNPYYYMSSEIAGSTAHVDNPGDRVLISDATEALRSRVISSIDWTLSGNIGMLELTGSAIMGTGNNLTNSLKGNGADNQLYGLGGNDVLDGGYGADSLFGGAGNDELNAFNHVLDVYGYDRAYNDTSSNVLEGGLGDDVLRGGGGSDIYRFNKGDGADAIHETSAAGGDTAVDRIVLGAGIDPTDVTVTHTPSSDLLLTFANAGDKITISKWDAGSGYRLERLEFANGTVWDATALNNGGAAANSPPVVQNTIANQAATEDVMFSFVVPANTFADPDDGDVLTYMATRADGSALPSWLGFDAATRTFSGTPLNGDVGGLSLVVKATDKSGASVSSHFDVAVANLNDAPTGTVGVGGTATQGETLIASNSLTDPDGLGSIGYQWQSSTDGMNWTAIAGATGESFVPGAAQVGQRVRVTASYIDGHGTPESVDSVATPAIVGANNAPILAVALADQTAVEDAAFAYVVPAGSFTDIDFGDALIYTATRSDGSSLPAWLTFDNATRSFSGTPTSSAAGLWDVRVTATDLTGASISDDFVLDIANHIVGTGAANSLVGTGLRDVIEGLDGNDTLNGGVGADTLIGGLGNDMYVVDNVGDVVIENPGEGSDTVQSSVSCTLGLEVENLTLIGTAAINGAGNDLANVLTGNGGANTLVGGAGNDRLNGGAGADTLIGGIGNDMYVVDNLGDVPYENAGEGTDTVQSSIGWTLGAEFENLTLTGSAAINGTGNELNNAIVGNGAANVLDGGAGDDSVTGGASADILIGGEGNDLLNGGLGADTMSGGAGDDTYTVDDANDVVAEHDGEGLDVVSSSVSYALAANIERLTLSGTASIDGTGNAQDNLLTGNVGVNVLSGGAGNDALNGAAGADNMIGGLGDDTYVVDNVGDLIVETADEGVDQVNASVSFTLADNVDNLSLTSTAALAGTGNAQNNVLTGNAAANTLNGGGGADTLIGGLGNDLYVVDDAADVVVENAAQGTDTVQSGVSYTLGANVENLFLTGSDAIDGSGNELNNILTGNAAANTLAGELGNDTLNGGAGADTLIGGLGNDIYVVDDSAAVAVENAAEGTDTVKSSVNYALGANLENLVLTGTDAINGSGNELANTLTGNVAANTLAGGLGNDIYVIADAGDVIVENAAEGTDTVQSSVSYTLGANLENLTLTGTAAIDGTGNELNNVLTGNAGANILAGGLGNDAYTINGTADVIVENAGEGTDTVRSSVGYTLGANLENLTLTGIAAIDGSGNEQNNALTGNVAANILTGGAGNDSLNGAAGADTLIGGLGDDTYTVDNIADMVVESSGEGLDLVNALVTYTLAGNVERLTLTGTLAIDGTGNEVDNLLTGNAAANVLSGGAGNDTLNGGAGADRLIGGSGNDSYTVDNVADTVVELAGEGVDQVNASVGYALSDNVENLTLTGSTAINAAGNALDNLLTGNSAINTLAGGLGNDWLDGKAGADTLIGGTGDDVYVVDNVGDVVVEVPGEGVDSVQASLSYILAAEVENLTLIGTSSVSGTGNALDNVITGTTGNNTLTGNAGNDTLDGKAGNDVLVGGVGNDTYVLGRGYGNDSVRENDAMLGNIDAAQFLAGIAADQIWLRHVGNNLEASIIGTTDKLTLENWYLGSGYHVEQLKTADGKLLLDSRVENLVQAMAVFAPPAAGQSTLPPTYQDILAPVIAANWQ